MKNTPNLGLMRPIPLRREAPRSWRPARMAQGNVREGEPTATQRLVHLGIFATGVAIGITGWSFRREAVGTLMLGSGSSMAGVGLAFFVMDLFGFRP